MINKKVELLKALQKHDYFKINGIDYKLYLEIEIPLFLIETLEVCYDELSLVYPFKKQKKSIFSSNKMIAGDVKKMRTKNSTPSESFDFITNIEKVKIYLQENQNEY